MTCLGSAAVWEKKPQAEPGLCNAVVTTDLDQMPFSRFYAEILKQIPGGTGHRSYSALTLKLVGAKLFQRYRTLLLHY